ncbi:MAG: D-alanine--D-alanine ligase family protein, partial [Thermoanaerobaculia bacterium]
ADRDLPVRLAAAGAELVFNIAEGSRGRSREAQVPALCEMLGLACTGSDAVASAVSLDKALSKRLLRDAGIPTPRFSLLQTGREPLAADLRYPLIAKPNLEGTSKGLGAESVVDDERALRALAGKLLERYRQPVIVEEYIAGRELTVGLIGHPRARALPPMEVVFRGGEPRPVYGYAYKQDFCEQVVFERPARLAGEERARVERAALEAFEALGCRDVARVDLRLDAAGTVWVLEVNPLPGLSPGWSDLCLITEAAGIPYRDLVGEILAGARARRGSG